MHYSTNTSNKAKTESIRVAYTVPDNSYNILHPLPWVENRMPDVVPHSCNLIEVIAAAAGAAVVVVRTVEQVVVVVMKTSLLLH